MEGEKKCFYKVKFIIIGEAGVGKTNLVHRFAKGEFNEKYAVTLGIDFLSSYIQVEEKFFNLELWDTAGSEQFKSITKGYYNNSACAIIVYDITDRTSFLSIKQWIEDCKNYTNKNIIFVLVGNKIDLNFNRVVEKEEGQNFADENNMIFYETSALTAENVENVFFDACKIIGKKLDEEKYDINDESYGIRKCYTTKVLNINKRKFSDFSDGNSKTIGKNKKLQKIKTKKKKCCE